MVGFREKGRNCGGGECIGDEEIAVGFVGGELILCEVLWDAGALCWGRDSSWRHVGNRAGSLIYRMWVKGERI